MRSVNYENGLYGNALTVLNRGMLRGKRVLKNRILNNNLSIGVPNDHGKHGALIIVAIEQGYNEYHSGAQNGWFYKNCGYIFKTEFQFSKNPSVWCRFKKNTRDSSVLQKNCPSLSQLLKGVRVC